MDTVLFTQRVEIIESYGERRDCADQDIARFIHVCGFFPVPVPNIKEIAYDMFMQLKPAGIVLTGGCTRKGCGRTGAYTALYWEWCPCLWFLQGHASNFRLFWL